MVRYILLLLLLSGCSFLMRDIVGNGYTYKHQLPKKEQKDPLFWKATVESYYKNQTLWIRYQLITGTRVDSAQMRFYIDDGGTYSNPVQQFKNDDKLKFNLQEIPDSLNRVIAGDFEPPKMYDYIVIIYLWRDNKLWTNADRPFKFKTSQPR